MVDENNLNKKLYKPSYLYYIIFTKITWSPVDKMDKILRSAVNIYKVPRLGQLNARLGFNYALNNQQTQKRSNLINNNSLRLYSSSKPPSGLSGSKFYSGAQQQDDKHDQKLNIVDVLEREIQDESTELSQHLSTDQFPGFSVETDDADVKLSKQVGNTTINVRFTVSSSLNEWTGFPEEGDQNPADIENMNSRLVSMPEFQVQITKNNNTLELSCYFEENDVDDETGETHPSEPSFGIEELVLYSGEPKETEFAVSAEYFQEDLQVSLMDYLAKYGIEESFAKNLVDFATSYEKKQYISLLKRLKNFVA